MQSVCVLVCVSVSVCGEMPLTGVCFLVMGCGDISVSAVFDTGETQKTVLLFMQCVEGISHMTITVQTGIVSILLGGSGNCIF